jgi:hypothetical protein
VPFQSRELCTSEGGGRTSLRISRPAAPSWHCTQNWIQLFDLFVSAELRTGCLLAVYSSYRAQIILCGRLLTPRKHCPCRSTCAVLHYWRYETALMCSGCEIVYSVWKWRCDEVFWNTDEVLRSEHELLTFVKTEMILLWAYLVHPTACSVIRHFHILQAISKVPSCGGA